jgi:hypothetical protein
MNQPLEMVILKLRQEYELRTRHSGSNFYGTFKVELDIQDGQIRHGSINGIKFLTPKEMLDKK